MIARPAETADVGVIMAKMSHFFKRVLLASASLFLFFLVVVAAVFIYAEVQLPDVEKLKDVHLQVPLRVYSGTIN